MNKGSVSLKSSGIPGTEEKCQIYYFTEVFLIFFNSYKAKSLGVTSYIKQP